MQIHANTCNKQRQTDKLDKQIFTTDNEHKG